MRVTLLAATTIAPQGGGILPPEHGTTSADHLAELAGRTCYRSYDRPNPATAANSDYLANIIRQKHFSVLSHASATFLIEGVSRNLTHELVRHRWLSFSQESTRYVEPIWEDGLVYPPGAAHFERYLLGIAWDAAHSAYRDCMESLAQRGITGKAAREVANRALPGSTPTSIVVSGNHRAWRDLLAQRLSPGADAEFRRLALMLLDELVKLAPNTYQDFTKEGTAE